MMMTSGGIFAQQQQKGTAVEPQTLVAFVLCMLGCVAVYQFVAEQAFSSVLTMSTFAQCLSFTLIGLQIHSSKSVAGISGRTMVLQAIMICLRLSSTLFLDGYLPLDKTGDHVYQIADICTLLMVLKIVHCVYGTHRHTYNVAEDSMDVKNMVIGCVLLAVAVHPSLNDWPTFDIAWAASLYIDTISILPQLWMSSKLGSVPAYTAHYLAATLVSRFFSAWFWYYGAENIARLSGQGWFCASAAMIVLAHVVQFLMLADFGVYYFKAGVSGVLSSGQAVDLSSGYDICI
jgi:hypothetical protein